jgi:hypothetical protein
MAAAVDRDLDNVAFRKMPYSRRNTIAPVAEFLFLNQNVLGQDQLRRLGMGLGGAWGRDTAFRHFASIGPS